MIIKSQLTMKIQFTIPDGLTGEQIAKEVYNIVRSRYNHNIHTQTYIEIVNDILDEEGKE